MLYIEDLIVQIKLRLGTSMEERESGENADGFSEKREKVRRG